MCAVNFLLQVDDTSREDVSKRDCVFRPYFSVVTTNIVETKIHHITCYEVKQSSRGIALLFL